MNFLFQSSTRPVSHIEAAFSSHPNDPDGPITVHDSDSNDGDQANGETPQDATHTQAVQAQSVNNDATVATFITDAVDNPDTSRPPSPSLSSSRPSESGSQNETSSSGHTSLDMPIFIQCIGCNKSYATDSSKKSVEKLIKCCKCGLQSHTACVRIQFGIDDEHESDKCWVCPACDPNIELWDDS